MQVIVITGPTAVGKTKLSIELAKKFNGEVINADSTQIYKDLDIATAKVTTKEMDGIKHHLLSIKNIDENYTVFDYQKDARKIIDKLLEEKKTPILVGGTGLYIKAALYDYKFVCEEKINDYTNLSNDELYEKVLSLDPYNDIHKNNRKRLERALNYMENHHLPFSAKEKTDKLLYNTIFIGLTTSREILYNRINNRVDDMVEVGLIDEAKKIYDSKIRTKAIITPIGYKELFPYFEGKESLEKCLDLIKQRSRNYAKKQYTWFNNQMNITWFDVCFDDFNKTINEVEEYIKKRI